MALIRVAWPAPSITLKDLCARNIEGVFQGTIASRPYRFTLLCLEDDRIVTTTSDGAIKGNVGQYLSTASVDGDSVILSNFAVAHDDRKAISSKSQLTYLKINLAALLTGRLRGHYHNGNLSRLLPVDAHKIEDLPHYSCDRARHISAQEMVGSFKIKNGPARHSKGPQFLVSDILLDAPLMTLTDGSQEGQQLADSAEWDGSGCFTVSTSEGDGEPDAHPLFTVRGIWRSAGHLEFYVINYFGIQGPFLAER